MARVARHDFEFAHELAEFELAALYIAGLDAVSKGQFHLQLTAIADDHPALHASVAHRYMPDVAATASPAQLAGSRDYVVFACAVVGELDANNPENSVELSHPGDVMQLQFVASHLDRMVWDTMDSSAYALLERVISPRGSAGIEYWHGGANGNWLSIRPSSTQIRSTAVMHDASTMPIGGSDSDATVGLNYDVIGIDNVYVTGSALWPTAGSWNPTLTMVALAQHLADRMTRSVTRRQGHRGCYGLNRSSSHAST
ncbi:MAG TPA: GMC oxidoreductase [Solirubrobacteraceae bacterium]|nr:GMC oxidoreductase [Solirubrobacteraceae bacterium]